MSLETKLAGAGLSTNLTDFERVNVGVSDAPDRKGRCPDGETISVTVYGNDGRKFTRTYCLAEGDSAGDERRLELLESDERVERFDADLRERFAHAVELALRNEGYAV